MQPSSLGSIEFRMIQWLHNDCNNVPGDTWHRMGVCVCVWDCVPMWLSTPKHLIAQLIEVASSTTAIHSAAGVISVNVTGNNIALSLPTLLSPSLPLSLSLPVFWFDIFHSLCGSQSSRRRRRRRQCLRNGNILSIIHQQSAADASKSRLDCTLYYRELK